MAQPPDLSAPTVDQLMRGATVSGAADLADDFSRALRQLRLDPADWIAPYTGDIVARRLELATRSLAEGFGALLHGFAGLAARSLAGERGPGVTLGASSSRREAIDEVLARAGELESRIARIEAKRPRLRHTPDDRVQTTGD